MEISSCSLWLLGLIKEKTICILSPWYVVYHGIFPSSTYFFLHNFLKFTKIFTRVGDFSVYLFHKIVVKIKTKHYTQNTFKIKQ